MPVNAVVYAPGTHTYFALIPTAYPTSNIVASLSMVSDRLIIVLKTVSKLSEETVSESKHE
jgi:hypothetical protein